MIGRELRRPRLGDDAIAGDARGLNAAVSIYFADATLASASRCAVVRRVETAGGVFQVREDEPAPRVGARLHRTL